MELSMWFFFVEGLVYVMDAMRLRIQYCDVSDFIILSLLF
jgi:hypothetical protein